MIVLLFMSGCAFMTGQALASAWRPAGLTVGYGLALAAAARFLAFALFEAELLSSVDFARDALILVGVAVIAHRMTLARKMADQYPWIYERAGLFAWRERGR